jgi:hypothetical protein
MKTYDWTQATRELLSQCTNILWEILKEWETFKSSDGDIGYFFNFDYSQDQQDQTHRSLRAIKEMFEALQNLHQKLVGLQDSCKNFTKDVSQSHFYFCNHILPEITSADRPS